MNYKNVNIYNLVRIMYKFRADTSFQYLVGYFLKLIFYRLTLDWAAWVLFVESIIL